MESRDIGAHAAPGKSTPSGPTLKRTAKPCWAERTVMISATKIKEPTLDAKSACRTSPSRRNVLADVAASDAVAPRAAAPVGSVAPAGAEVAASDAGAPSAEPHVGYVAPAGAEGVKAIGAAALGAAK